MRTKSLLASHALLAALAACTRTPDPLREEAAIRAADAGWLAAAQAHDLAQTVSYFDLPRYSDLSALDPACVMGRRPPCS